jgi:phosphatidylglycerophosphatase A
VNPNLPARALATWLGCGLSPLAPGTVGSFGAIPLHLVLRRVHPVAHVAAVLGVTVAGLWSAQKVADELGIEDPQLVVIDEVAGALIAMGLVRGSASREAVALVLFRILDITKPGPIRRLEHAKPAGLGIMLDDLLAGLLAGVLTRWVR